MKVGFSARLGFSLLGFGLLGFLVWRIGPGRIASQIQDLGWGFAAVVALGGVSHLAKTWAWRLTFAGRRSPGYLRMLGIRLAGEAVSMLSFAGQVVGETTRALLLRGAVPMVKGVSSVVIDRGIFIFSGLLVILAGAALAPAIVTLPQQVRSNGLLVLAVLAISLLLALQALRRRWPILSLPVRFLSRLPGLGGSLKGGTESVIGVESTIHDFYHDSPGAFRASFAFNLLGHAMSVLEVYLILSLLGLPITLAKAFVIEALTKVVNFSGAVIPGNVGAYEGGNILILGLFGMSSADGLTLGITRRLRGLCWAVAGLAVLSRLSAKPGSMKETPSGGD